MRLGQLARQLSISPDKIVSFLGSRNIAIDSHNNARIDDPYVDLVLQEFAPGNELLRQEVIQNPDAQEVSESPPAMETSLESDPTQSPELIKAPKIELPGLRVVGKIELPEKKKPEPTNEPTNKEQDARPEPRQPFVSRNPRRSPPSREKNPVALAREREEKEKQRKLREEREQEKQRKAAYYKKRLKPQPPTKAARLVREEEFEEMAPLPAERPRTLWGRFLRWLNH